MSRSPTIARKVRRRRRQCAALPLVETTDGVTLVLLITSLETRRWVVPKGWAERGVAAHAQAAREAFEEAGLLGEIGRKPLGSYRYDKVRRGSPPIPVRVDVFPMRVTGHCEDWPEKGRRDAIWVEPEEAAALVDEPGLAAILRGLAAPAPPLRDYEAIRPTA